VVMRSGLYQPSLHFKKFCAQNEHQSLRTKYG